MGLLEVLFLSSPFIQKHVYNPRRGEDDWLLCVTQYRQTIVSDTLGKKGEPKLFMHSLKDKQGRKC